MNRVQKFLYWYSFKGQVQNQTCYIHRRPTISISTAQSKGKAILLLLELILRNRKGQTNTCIELKCYLKSAQDSLNESYIIAMKQLPDKSTHI